MDKRTPKRQRQVCDFCKHDHEFDLPAEIVEAAIADTLVLFAGAGISTESPYVLPYTLRDQIAWELDDKEHSSKSFSALMSTMCAKSNGRRRLLTTIKKRFDTIDSFPQLLKLATGFHIELSTLPHLSRIVTTNWDDYFERFCGATPIVTDKDFAFWDMPGRKVFKLHGSVTNYGSIVATDDDYEKCYVELNEGVVGANLKLMLSTATVLFAGYSLRDEDFCRVYSLLQHRMGDLLPHAYALTIDVDSAKRFEALGITPIVTDARYFVTVLKSHMVAQDVMLPESRLEGVLHESMDMHRLHHRLASTINPKRHPDVIYCLSYQDGILDAFGRMMVRYNTGEYSCKTHVVRLAAMYEGFYREKLRRGLYEDAAYARGYENGLLYLVHSDRMRRRLPRYFLFGRTGDIRTLRDFKKLCCASDAPHKRARRNAARIVKTMKPGQVLHHRPSL